MARNKTLTADGDAGKKYASFGLLEQFKFMEGRSSERALGLYVLKGTRTALRGGRGSNPSALPG